MARKKESDQANQPPASLSEPLPAKGSASSRLPALKRRALTRLSKTKPTQDPLWQLLDTKLGGRTGLMAAALASNNPKARDLAEMLADPAYTMYNTKKLAKRVGLTAPEIVEMYRDRKWLEATLALHEQLPDIVRDASVDARAGKVPCDACKGKGVDWEKGDGGTPCYICRGTGELRKPGDKDKLKFVGEAVGMVGKTGPAVEINNQTVVNAQSNTVSFEDLMRKAALQTSKPKVIDVVKVEDEHQNPES